VHTLQQDIKTKDEMYAKLEDTYIRIVLQYQTKNEELRKEKTIRKNAYYQKKVSI